MPPSAEGSLARLLYEIRRKAGHTDFDEGEAITVIRQVVEQIELGNIVVQVQARGPTYFVSDNGVRRNYCTNPSFEHTLTSWTETITGTGSSGRTSESGDFDVGLAALELLMTDSAASGDVVQRAFVTSSKPPASGEVWSCSARVRIEALTTSKVRLRMEFLDSSDVVQATHNTDSTTVFSTYTDIKVENKTAPATTAKIRVTVIIEATAANATGIVQVDGVMIEEASSIVSVFDGDSQDCFWDGDTNHDVESFNDVDGTAAIVGHFKAS